jgi:hypothetical protein
MLPGGWERIDAYSPPLLDYDNNAWVMPLDFGHGGLGVSSFPVEKTDEGFEAAKRKLPRDIIQAEAREQLVSAITSSRGDWDESVIPAFKPMRKINIQFKRAIDPNNLANPTRFVNLEKAKDL